ncbi:MAG: alpha-beta hydrolase superfamily lysophospholipase, partial [Paracoccaceae bacterium]
PISVLYVHGLSATSQEIRPVPDRIAAALGANLVYTRLRGHGRGSDPMAEATVQDWMSDTAEGLAAARAVGERVVVISTSTGGTLVAAALQDPQLAENVAAVIFVSPNFGVNHPLAFMSTWPFARTIIRLAEGERRNSEPGSEAQAKYWSYNYPTSSVAVMSALIKAVVSGDFAAVTVPALFWYSEADKVVRPDITRDITGRWGGPVTVKTVIMGPTDDPSSHVITGDIMSPGQTDIAVDGMLDWLETVLN